MDYRQLGRSGLRVSAVGLGGNMFGRDTDADRTARIISQALEAGINFFDTADVYPVGHPDVGISEQHIGAVLAGAARHQALIATKVCWPMGELPNDRGLSRKHILDGVEGSLKRLNTDYIDLYQLHEADPWTPLEETLRALDDLVAAGKVRYVGASNFAGWQLVEAAAVADRRGFSPLVSLQARYNVLDRAIERELLPVCRQLGLGVITYAPLSGGILTGKYLAGEAPPPDSRVGRTPRLQRQLTPERLQQVACLAEIAREHGRTPSQLALAWLLAHAEVATVIAGASRPEQVIENAQAASCALSPEDVRRVDAAVHLE
jgi:aryl-alcohol dehydrogenase-like predicted oxidoreductase